MSLLTRTRRPSRFVQALLAYGHSVPLSVALHLVPGALVVVAYQLVGEPIVATIGYPIFLAWAIALVVVLAPLLGGLLWLGRERNGRYSLSGVVRYLDRPIPRFRLRRSVLDILTGWPGTTCRSLDEYSGEACPRGMQRLLSLAS